MILLLLLLSICINEINAGFRCFNYCNNHGRCDAENVCWCDDGWTGADCSQSKFVEKYYNYVILLKLNFSFVFVV